MKSSQFRALFVLVISVIIVQAQNTTTCPDGYDCLSEQICTGIPIKCSPGTWCPGGYNAADMCPKKHFCETPAEKEICPEGTYCRTAVLKAGECSDLAPCPEGSWRQNQFDYLLIMIATFVGLFGSFYVYERIKQKYFSSEAIESTIELPEVTPKGKSEAFGPSTTLESALETNSKLNLRFEDLGVVIPTKKGDKMILAGVSGEFKSGQVSAIMGPSGAGKTTLMSVLSGKLKNTSGKVFVNGREDSVSSFKTLVGYVPQEDVMLRTLRVREVLEHSARIRLPADMTDRQRIAIVNDVMKLLKIDHVADSIIGDAEKRGVSGGERKRVNIGLELVALPKLLFLDEPTTGLDANTSKEIMAFLRLIAQQGITVVMVIHQPRYEILQMCDELLLLAKGGKTVFMGSTDGAMDYFAHAGFPCPTHFNPADWYMDVISGKVSPKKSEEISTMPTTKSSEVTVALDSKTLLFDPTVLVDMWTAREPQTNTQTAVGGFVVNRQTPGFFVQFGWYLYRSLLQLVRNKQGLVLELSYQIITGVAMAMAGISDEMYIPPLPENLVQLCPAVIRHRCQNESVIPSIPITMFFMTMTAGLSSATAANRTFAEEKDVYYREAGSGINTVAYFISKCVFDLYSIARNAFVLITFYVVICDPPGSFAGWFGGMFFLMFAAHGMGYFISNIMPPAEALVVSMVAAVAWSVTSGLSPTLDQLEDYGPLQFFWWISYCRWGAESLYVTVISDWSDYMRVKDNSGYDKDNYGMDLGMMFVLGIAWRVAAYIALRYKNKDKQK